MLRFGLAVSAAVVAVDQASKFVLLAALSAVTGGELELLPFFNLVLVWNRGITFGLLSSHSVLAPWALSAFALAVSLGLGVWLVRAESRLIATTLGLTIGGAVGNVIDRVRFGAVVDFLDFHAGGWHWPAFNVADAAITIGVFGMVGASLLHRPQATRVRRRS